MSNKKTNLNMAWLKNEKFKPWLKVNEKSNCQNSFYCVLCKKSVSLSNMGIQAIVSHMNSKKHNICVSASESVNMSTFINKKDEPVVVSEISETTQTSEKPKVQQRIQTERDQITRAEIIWSLHVISSHISMSAGGKSILAMKRMFDDSDTAKNISLQRTKLTYIINYGLARYFCSELDDLLAECDFYSIAFDESLNKICQKEQMDVHVRFWNIKNNEVVCRYLTSVFLGHSTALDLIEAIEIAINKLNTKKILQISMDGPNVNHKMLRDLNEKLEDIHDPIDPHIIDIGSCGLHTMHNSFKNAIKMNDWKIVEFLRAIYNVFKDVPARRADYIHYSGGTVFPKKFCAVRWLQNVEVSERAIEILPNLRKYVNGVKNTNRMPTSYSYKMMVFCLDDKFLQPRLAFFQTLALDVEPFLRFFQSDEPLVPFLYTDLIIVLKTVLSRFIKQEALNKYTDISKIDILNKECNVGAKKINLGYLTRAAIRTIEANDKEMLMFRTECLTILQTFCQKILTKSPLKFKLVKGLTFCDPNVISSSRGRVALLHLKTTLAHMIENRWINGNKADIIERDFTNLFSNETFLERAKCFIRNKTRLDYFWRNICVEYEMSDIQMDLLKKIFVLSHGNATVERGFSINKECIFENLSEESLVNQRHVWAGIHSAGGVENINISKKMILTVRSARSYYNSALEKKKKDIQDKEKMAYNKKRAGEKLKELKEKKIKLLEEAKRNVDAIEEEMKNIS